MAYPEVAWGTSYEDMIRLDSEALGLADEGDALIEDLHGEVEAALANHPELADATVLFSYIDPADFSQIGFYTSLDTRPGFLASLGLPLPTIVEEESAGTDSFYLTVSSEEADRFARRRRVRDLRRAGRRDHRPAAGRPAPLADPGHRRGPHRDPRELHAARRIGEPVAPLHRLGNRRVLRPPRKRPRADPLERHR